MSIDTPGQAGDADGPPPENLKADAPESDADPRAELARMEDRWLRAMADLDNLRKRMAREGVQQRAQERAAVAAAWLPVLDNLELALAHAPDPDAPFVQGIAAIREQAVDTLARLGYPRIDTENVPFDPHQHEVASVVDDADVPPGTVVSVLRPGYGSETARLRPASVVVSRAREPGHG